MTLQEKESLLAKASYTRKDVEQLANVKSSRANVIMAICREKYAGAIPYRTNVITSESYWKYEGTTLERQIAIYRKGTK